LSTLDSLLAEPIIVGPLPAKETEVIKIKIFLNA
jgi:hypothetical protein